MLRSVSGSSGGSGGVPLTNANFADNETPTGTINGTTGSDGNADFTLAYAPSPAASLQLFKNGQEMAVGTAYTLSSLTITYQAGYIPIIGDVHRAYYRHA